MQSPFVLQLLGQFQLFAKSEPVPGLTSEKAQALLAYLAAEPAQPQSREMLAELLWPDRPDGVARQNLRQTLSRLQRTLPATKEPLLHTTRQTVRLNHDVVQIDLDAFTATLAAVNAHPHPSPNACLDCCQMLTAAVDQYQGDFLDGLFCDSPAFDEWVLLKRQWLQREVLRVLDILVQHHESRQAWQAAYRFAWRRVELDPLLEVAHQQVMRTLAHSGRRAAALAQYETLTRLLREELELSPATESTTLYEAIRSGQLANAESGTAIPVQSRPQPMVPHNLPPQQMPFVGRRRELQQIAERLTEPACHLLTLVGPGGVGKTRLALETARHQLLSARYPDGIFFVNLATAEDDDQFLSTVATAIEFTFPDEVQGRSARLQALVRELQEKQLLLLLDNLEQLAEDTEVPTAILNAAPNVQLLVTSRVPLHLHAEWLLDITGLSYPDAQADTAQPLATLEAVQFFNTAAQRRLADFTLSAQTLALVGELCTLTEGVPLALELAAAQARSVPLPVLVAAVEANMDSLATTMRDIPPRHRSLRAVFDHSWHLLTPPLQQLFSQLAVFRGTFTSAAATAVTGCREAALAELCAFSLLRVEESGATTAYAMHEVLRQYAAEQLSLDPLAAAHAMQQHSHYYLTLVADAEEALGSSQAAPHVAIVRAAFANIRRGWQWAVANLAMTLIRESIHGLQRYFILTSQAEEGGRLFDAALRAMATWQAEQSSVASPDYQDAQVLIAELHALRARLFFKQARYAEGIEHAQQALTIADACGALRCAILARFYWAICLLSLGEYDAAEEKLATTLQLLQQHKWPKVESDVLRSLGILADQQHDLPKARRFYEAALAIGQTLDDPRGTSASLGNLGSICRQQGDFVAAKTFLAQSLSIHRAIGDRSSEGRTLTHLGELAMDLEEFGAAEQSLGESIHLLRELGEEHYAADALVVLGRVYQQQGRIALAIACWEEALPIYVAANEAPQLNEVRAYLQSVQTQGSA